MSLGMTRNEILQNLSKLAEHDREEVFEYMEQGVYFLGTSRKTEESHDIFGYFTINKGDHIMYRYEVLECLGKGGYGVVLSAFDHKLKRKVAIKIMRKGNNHNQKQKFFDEIKIYEYLSMCYKKEIPELGQMLENFVFRGDSIIVLKKCHTDLYFELQKNKFKGFRIDKVKRIVQSILKGLKFLHSVNLIHGDIKPDNIAFTKRNSSEVTLLDLGNSKFGYQNFREYDQCRFYRSPEVILRLTQGPWIDVWGLGCVAYQLATGITLFKGYNEYDQLSCMMRVLGIPPKSLIRTSSIADKYFYDNCLPRYCYVKLDNKYFQRGGIPNLFPGQDLPSTQDPFSTLKKKSPQFVSFLKQCLKWNGHERMTVTEALSHEWLLQKRVRSIRKCSKVKKVQKSISSDTILLNQPLRHVFQEMNKELPKISSSIDFKDKKLDMRTQWLSVRSKYIRKNL